MTKKTKHTTRARTKADHRASTTGGRVISLADVLSGPLATAAAERVSSPLAGAGRDRRRGPVAPAASGLLRARRTWTRLVDYTLDLVGEIHEMLRLFDAVGARVVADFSADRKAFERIIVGGLRSVNGIREILIASDDVDQSCFVDYANDLAAAIHEMLRLFDAVGAQVVGDFSAVQEAFERVVVSGLRSVNGIREILMASTEGDPPPVAGAEVEVSS